MNQDKELNIKVLFASLAEKGIVKIAIGFDGSGDSGAIEDNISYYVENDDSELILSEDISSQVDDQLIELGYHILDRYYDYDWYNNEGGYGTINIDIKDQNWDIEGFQRIQDVEEVSGEGDLSIAVESFIK
jgi:uncharacterized protein YdeI (BOF family)